MAVYKQISSKAIIRKVMRDIKPNNANWIDDAIEWIGEALDHIGASAQLVQKQCVLTIKDHKVLMPTDLYYINQVATAGTVGAARGSELDTLTTQVRELKDVIKQYNTTLESDLLDNAANVTNADLATYDTQYKANVTELRELISRITVLENIYFGSSSQLTALSYGASTFHASMHCSECVNEFAFNQDSYIVDGSYIKTSFNSGTICLSYTAFPTDEDCYPLVPDDISFKEAMFWYIFKQMLLGGYDKPTNKIDYAFADQKWQQYCTQARNSATFPSIDKYASFMDQWVRLVPDIDRHQTFFEFLNDRESLDRG
jgi:hypothetical protein